MWRRPCGVGFSLRIRLHSFARLGVARAASPDVRCGHPALRYLPASFAFGILPSLAAKAGSRGTGNPSLGFQK